MTLPIVCRNYFCVQTREMTFRNANNLCFDSCGREWCASTSQVVTWWKPAAPTSHSSMHPDGRRYQKVAIPDQGSWFLIDFFRLRQHLNFQLVIFYINDKSWTLNWIPANISDFLQLWRNAAKSSAKTNNVYDISTSLHLWKFAAHFYENAEIFYLVISWGAS